MDFRMTDEHTGFAASLNDLLTKADSVSVARSWAAGDTAPGKALWKRLADQGVCALVVPEDCGGMGGTPTDAIVAFEVLGYHLAVGPFVESAAFLARAASGADLEAIAEGQLATVAIAPWSPYAVDADQAEVTYAAHGSSLVRADIGQQLASVDVTRRLFVVADGTPAVGWEDAVNLATLATAAELLGCGERLLADTVSYVKQRTQYGRIIGSYQGLKHQLADVRIALDFARPLVQGASLTLDGPTGTRDVSAAKAAANDAAYLASRVALQLHGAIGYTAEFDLGLWINRVRAKVSSWGDSHVHRGRIAAALVEA